MTRSGRVPVLRDGPAARARAAEALRGGGIVALPTDTVYGIAAALETPGGIERLFALKRRPPEKGIALLLADADQARTLGVLGPAAEALANDFWPGGLTLVVPIRDGTTLPEALTGGSGLVGLRVPDHDAPRGVARIVGPLPTTSANVSGQPEAPDAGSVVEQLGEGITLVVDGGPAHGGPASTVVRVDGEGTVVLRAGAIDVIALAACLARSGLPAPDAA